MAKKMRKFAGEEGSLVDPLEKANKEFEVEEATKPKAEAKSEPEAPAPKPKAKVVTKEELAKSGLSLRDYMNKQQGLTRREPKKDPTAGEASDTSAQRLADRLNPNTGKFAPTGYMERSSQVAKDNYAKTGPTDINSMMKARLQPKPKATLKYASGGSVTRGDGCAQRGKTRGMMR